MINDRMTELLKSTAKDANEGIQPLSHGFLSDNDVTLDEAYDLSDWIAMCINITLQLDKTLPGRDLMAQHIAFAMVEDELRS